MFTYGKHHRAALIASASMLAVGAGSAVAGASLPQIPHGTIDGAVADVAQVQSVAKLTAQETVQGVAQQVDSKLADAQHAVKQTVAGAQSVTKRVVASTQNTTQHVVANTQSSTKRVVSSTRGTAQRTISRAGGDSSRVLASANRTVRGTRSGAVDVVSRLENNTQALLRADVHRIQSGVASILADTNDALSNSGSIRSGSEMFGTYAISWSQVLGCWQVSAHEFMKLSVRC